MIAIFAAAVLQVQPNAGLCSIAYAIELRRRQAALGIPSPIDPSKLDAKQRNSLFSLDSIIDDGRIWIAVAFSRNELDTATGPVYARLSRAPDEQAAAFRSCTQIKAADQEPPVKTPPPPAPGAPDQCVTENAAVHREIQQRASADAIRAHALKAMSGIAQGTLTCHSVEQARVVWMEIGAAAGAAVAKALYP